MFGTKKIKRLEARVKNLEAAQRAESYRYGTITLQDLVKIVEKTPSEKPTAKKETVADNKTTVLYICDRKACEDNCIFDCSHTSDIRHAKNFVPIIDGVYKEITTKNQSEKQSPSTPHSEQHPKL